MTAADAHALIVFCIAFMLFLDWMMGLVTVFIAAILYKYIEEKAAKNISWGSASDGRAYVSALRATLDLQHVSRHVKNWRPQFLALTGFPDERPGA